ncbi:MAG: glycogen synthase [Nitrospirae bacterium]|nr:glycogen synthase [Nitrospirota bacterium]
MKIAIAASEAFPFSKTGGLADVTGALWKEFSIKGHETILIAPLYKETAEYFGRNLPPASSTITISTGSSNIKCDIYLYSSGNAKAIFIGNKKFFMRSSLYGTDAGYVDNGERFSFFCRAAIEAVETLGLRLDIIHCNDWQTALIPLLIKTTYKNYAAFKNCTSLMTIHNLGYQGHFNPDLLPATGLDLKLFNPEGIEFYGKINFLKAGIIGADIVATVSRNYANEILTPENGFGLEGLLKNRIADLYGIPNGIDCDIWDPAADPFLPSNYSAANRSGKTECRKSLIKNCGFNISSREPVFTFVGRLASQKGIDLIVDAANSIVKMGCLFIVGKGEQKYHTAIEELHKKHPYRINFFAGFDESAARLAYAGSDIFVMPSLYEPCGLVQMIAMRYGCVPVARNTGGLADTIVSAECLPAEDAESSMPDIRPTGFLFDEFSASALTEMLFTATLAFNMPDVWNKLVLNSMTRDFSWSKSANIYLELYRKYRKNLKG